MTPDRLFLLLRLLEQSPTTTAAVLASHVGVSVRTLRRDLQWLNEAGYPVLTRAGKYGGVIWVPGSFYDLSRLSPQEQESVSVLGLDASQRKAAGLDVTIDRAMEKLGQSVRRTPETLRDANAIPLRNLVVTDHQPWFAGQQGPDIGTAPAALLDDLRAGSRLRVLYRRSQHGVARWRTVDPYGLFAKSGRWYLVADQAGEPRLFALTRVQRWEALESRRRLRPGIRLEDLAHQLVRQWEQHGELRVQLLLAPHQVERAHRLLGSRLVPPSDVAEHGISGGASEWMRLDYQYQDLEEVRGLLPFGPDLLIISPPEAKQRLRDLAEQTASLYSD